MAPLQRLDLPERALVATPREQVNYATANNKGNNIRLLVHSVPPSWGPRAIPPTIIVTRRRMSLRVSAITVPVSVPPLPMIVPSGAMLATTPSNATAAAAATAAAWRRRRRGLRFALLPILSELRQHVPQLMIPQVHLASKVVRQSAVRVKNGQVRAADIANTQFLVSGCTRRICK